MGLFDFKPNVDKMKIKKDIGGLIKALQYKDSAVRQQAIIALTEIKDPRAIEPLIQTLKNRNIDNRIGAALALGMIKDKRAVVPILDAFVDNCVEICNGFAVALGSEGTPWEKVREIEYALKDESLFVLLAAPSWALEKMMEDPTIDFIIHFGVIRDYFKRAFQGTIVALVEIGEPAVELLIQALKNDRIVIKAAAAMALGMIKEQKAPKDKRAIEPLIQALKDENIGVRFWVAMSLGFFIKNRKVVDSLTQALNIEKDESTKLSIIISLRKKTDLW